MAESERNEPIEIFLDRRKLLRTNLSSWLISAGLGYCSFAPWLRSSMLTKLLSGLARILFVIWIWFIASTIFRLLFPRPIVVVDEKGIAYHPASVGPFDFQGVLSWNQIQALYVGERVMQKKRCPDLQRFLCILPRDIETYLEHRSLLNKTVLSMLVTTLKTPFVIPQNLLPISSDELLERIKTEYAATLETNAIEIHELYIGSFSGFKQHADETNRES